MAAEARRYWEPHCNAYCNIGSSRVSDAPKEKRNSVPSGICLFVLVLRRSGLGSVVRQSSDVVEWQNEAKPQRCARARSGPKALVRNRVSAFVNASWHETNRPPEVRGAVIPKTAPSADEAAIRPCLGSATAGRYIRLDAPVKMTLARRGVPETNCLVAGSKPRKPRREETSPHHRGPFGSVRSSFDSAGRGRNSPHSGPKTSLLCGHLWYRRPIYFPWYQS